MKTEVVKVLNRANDILRESPLSRIERYKLIISLITYHHISYHQEIMEKRVLNHRYPYYLPEHCHFNSLVNSDRYSLKEQLISNLVEIETKNDFLNGIFPISLFQHLDSNYLVELIMSIHYSYDKLISDCDTQIGVFLQEWLSPREGNFGSDLPIQVAELMLLLLGLTKNEDIYDPSFRVGGMLISPKSFDGTLSEYQGFTYGETKQLDEFWFARVLMILSNNFNVDVRLGDALLNPQFKESNSYDDLKTFNKIVSFPPINQKFFNHEEWSYLGGKRTTFGIPPKSNANYAWLLHQLAALAPEGKLVTLVSSQMLVTDRAELYIRSALISEDLIEAVISLPSKILQSSSVDLCILIINKNKSEKLKTLFIDAKYDYLKSRRANELTREHINNIIQTYNEFQDIGTYSKAVSLDDIKAKNYSLAVKEYVDNSPNKKIIERLQHNHKTFKEYSFNSSLELDKRAVLSMRRVKAGSEAKANSVFISTVQSRNRVLTNLDELTPQQQEHYIEVQFNENIVLCRYAKLYLDSELGRLSLEHISSGTFARLSIKDLHKLKIYVPEKSEQLKVLELANKLEAAESTLTRYKSDLITNPSSAPEIANQTNRIIFDLSEISDIERVKILVEINETKGIEFKQFFFLKEQDVYNPSGKVVRSEEEQTKVIKNIASFLNTDGGTLLLGVSDSGKLVGIDREMSALNLQKIEKYLKDLENKVTNLLGDSISKLVRLSSVIIDDKNIVIVDCITSPEPIFMKGENNKYQDFYIRRSSESEALYGYELLKYIEMHFKNK
ncbi:N-6 DNA methylase [Pseudoalteromonas sp. Angola-30]|uniref:N-6 DNA methylase n=1 Tax=Pseudoalteromonas sp. Angola-30 TaxID=3025341 RepID=UPI0023595A77|nr:N-6 DNA methylase [Pseudoalteromonas sp. Angola-30]MDC9527753.1 N-6 DNA methylase [Pseudoalteromonas sp. Angola-30]